MRELISSRICDEPFGYDLPLQKCWKSYNNAPIHLFTLFADPAQKLNTEGLLVFMEPKDSTIFHVSKWRNEVKVISNIHLSTR